MLAHRLGLLLVPVVTVLACTSGPGLPGKDGPQGPEGPAGCTPSAGELGIGLHGEVKVSMPANGQYFTPGETIQITARFEDRCQRPVDLSDLEVANLYISGPRAGLRTRAAVKLLNTVTDRTVADDQHHYINLIDPRFADPSQGNLGLAEDGTPIFTTAPVSDELPGTYSVGVWARTSDELDQVFETVDFQIGTSQRESYASGPPGAFPACGRCHWGPVTGKIYLRHSHPALASVDPTQAVKNARGMPLGTKVGNWVLDAAPIASCLQCHNQDGYSPIPLVAKIHAIHRGRGLKAPGVAHPELGLPADPSVAQYTNVVFPSLPEYEKDCSQCHVDDRWKTSPTPLGCIGCHEALFLDRGTLEPPRRYGKPPAGSCVTNANCASFSQYATCDVPSGECETRTHPTLAAEPNCAKCHTPDAPGSSPVSTRHAIAARVNSLGLRITDFSMSGASGPNGAFMAGDNVTLRFMLVDKAGNRITDLKSSSAWRLDVVVSGPTEDSQRLYGGGPPANKANLSYDTGTGFYTFAVPPLPATSLPPLNTPPGTPGRTNPPGTYAVYLWVSIETPSGSGTFDAGSILYNFKFGADSPIRPRQLILKSTCLGCHVEMTAHDGMRREPEACSMCHTSGALDRGIGAKGAACTVSAQCGGFALGWESCQDTTTPPDGVPDTCVAATDPTPGNSISMSSLTHAIHYGRRRAGYAASNNLVPGSTVYLSYNNVLTDFSRALLPLDMRNCTKCHADSGAPCISTSECGVGQECRRSRCTNVSWMQHTNAAACLACHDNEAAYAHVALETYQPPSGPPVEACLACHGETREFSPQSVHNISSPYVPPYPRFLE